MNNNDVTRKPYKYLTIKPMKQYELLRREGGSGGQKNKIGLYESPTCLGVTTFYGIAKSSFIKKIWPVKVRGYYSLPYKI